MHQRPWTMLKNNWVRRCGSRVPGSWKYPHAQVAVGQPGPAAHCAPQCEAVRHRASPSGVRDRGWCSLPPCMAVAPARARPHVCRICRRSWPAVGWWRTSSVMRRPAEFSASGCAGSSDAGLCSDCPDRGARTSAPRWWRGLQRILMLRNPSRLHYFSVQV